MEKRSSGAIRRHFYFSEWQAPKLRDLFERVPNVSGLIQLAAKRLGVRPSECVYVGDSPTDIEAGKAAGMKTILYGKRKDRDADASVASFKKLPALIAALSTTAKLADAGRP